VFDKCTVHSFTFSFAQREQRIVPAHIEQTKSRPSIQPSMRVVHAPERIHKIAFLEEMIGIVEIRLRHRKKIFSQLAVVGRFRRRNPDLLQGLPGLLQVLGQMFPRYLRSLHGQQEWGVGLFGFRWTAPLCPANRR
jgi:hypothetical protein